MYGQSHGYLFSREKAKTNLTSVGCLLYDLLWKTSIIGNPKPNLATMSLWNTYT